MLALVSLLIFLLTGQIGVQGYVWCLGEDGHAALEYAAGGSCGPGAQPQDQDCHGEVIFDLPSQEEHCGPCLDIPHSLNAISKRTQDHKDFQSHILFQSTAQVSAIPAFSRTLTANLYPQPPPRISQAILSHRTVVLLN